MGSSRKWLKIISGKKRLSCVNSEAALANDKPRKWRWWIAFSSITKKPKSVDADACKKGNGADLREERAAIRIQTAFRTFLARRALRALRGLVRLQAAINGHDARKQSAASLHCIQAFVRVQARIRRQCALKNRDALEVPLETSIADHTRTDSETADWCNSLGTLEDVQAKEQDRLVAAIKRERAIAYAFYNKWKANAKLNPGSLFDHELENSTWSWIWLDQWLNGGTIDNNRHHIVIKQSSQTAPEAESGKEKSVLRSGAGSPRKTRIRVSTRSNGGGKAFVLQNKALTKDGSFLKKFGTKPQPQHPNKKKHYNQPKPELTKDAQ